MTVANYPVAKTYFTPDDLLHLESAGESYELVDGQLVEKQMSAASGEVTAKITFKLLLFLEFNPIARVTAEAGFNCFPSSPGTVRRPDLAVVLSSRVRPEMWASGLMTIRPDIAIESLSPNDKILELDDKLDDYRDAEIPLVWVLKPERRSVLVFRPGQQPVTLEENDLLSGETVLPGFSVRVGDLFPPRVQPA